MSDLVETSQAATPARMLEVALSKGASMEQLEKLLDLQQRWEANEARKAFVVAMTAFKANPPTIVKDKTVAFSGTSYKHATLASVVDVVVLEMSKHGLSHNWTVAQSGADITVTCVITHILGHSESVSITAQKDDSGKKNLIQQVASTVTYLQRYTLMSVCGLAAKDSGDDDGKGGGEVTFITAEQAEGIKRHLMETGSDTLAFLHMMGGFPSVDEIPASKHGMAIRALDAKRKRMAV